MKLYKKYWIILVVLIVLTPLGIIVPHLFRAGGAWGEWPVQTVKEQTGQEPSGMKKTAALYHAPLPDYGTGKETDSLPKRSLSYIISGMAGTGIILLLTFGITKILSKKN